MVTTRYGPMDSKAIVGAAHGYLPGMAPLRPSEFTGGDASVASLLRSFGFEVTSDTDEPVARPVFREGEVYNRRRDIHAVLGGQQQGGISTPAGAPYVFLFTGEQGEQHGYRDGWSEGVFLYTGEGQIGDMQFERGNRAIRDHRASGKDLVLLEAMRTKGLYRCVGTFECVGWDYQPRPDREGAIRQAIVFQLQKVEGSSGPVPAPDVTVEGDLAQLRSRAFASAVIERGPRSSSRTIHARSDVVKAYVLRRANGICEACGCAAPFETRAGTPYLEPHHIDRLSDGGLDRPDVVGAICPTCHRRIHHGADGKELNDRLRKAIAQKEQALGSS
jgi:5-methylcytosine-specific restriction protein A